MGHRAFDDHEGTPDADRFSRACLDKVRWPSKKHAISAGRRTLAKDGATMRPGFVLNAYSCKACGKWHLGNSRRKQVDDDSSIVPETE